MKKRICFFTYNMFALGGIQRVVSVLASELSKHYDVFIQCYDDPSAENRSLYNLSPDINMVYSKRIGGQSPVRKALRKLNQKTGMVEKIGNPALLNYTYLLPEEQNLYKHVIEENKIDIAIAVGAFESYLLGSIANQVKCKTVGWQHNSYKAYYETPGMACWGMGYIIDKYFPMLDKYIVLNEYDEEQFWEKRHFKCDTIHNPKSFVCDQKAELKNKNFIAAGRFIYAKGFDLLIEAFKIFAEKNQDWNLTIYGTGDGLNNVKEKIHEYGLENRVSLPGFSDSMVENLLNSSCYLLSSRWEGMPMVILEALEVGIPVVSFDISAMIPLVDDGVEGLIVPQFNCEEFAKAMLKIAMDDDARMRMGTAAKEKAQKFTVEEVTKKWLQVLKEL